MKNIEASLHSRKTGNKRWFVVALLLAGGIINYLDRASLSMAAPDMMKDLQLTNTDIGILGSVFSLVYALCQLPAGWLADRFGEKKVYGWAVGLWSGATMLTGLCSNLTSLIFARAILGVTEAPCWPTAAKITAVWFPKKDRALATGFWDAASKWGPTIAPPILAGLILSFGWRSLFFIIGSAGIIYAAIFYFAYRQPEKHPSITPEELDYIKSGGGGTPDSLANDANSISWKSLFKYRSIWGMILGWFCYVWIFNILTTFLPLYLVKTQNIQLKELGIYASIPYMGGIVGAIIGGYASKWLMDKHIFKDALKAKRATIAVCALVAGAAIIMVPAFKDLTGTLILLSIGMAFLSALSATVWALPGDVAPPSMVGSVGSIQNFGGYFAGSLSPLTTGLIADITGSYALAFISGGAIAAGAALCYWFIVKDPIVES